MTELLETREETRDLTYRDGRSDKFWSITLEGQTHTVRFGRSGTAGQTQQKSFPTAAAARASMEKLVAEKLRKGYTEAPGAGAQTAPAQSPAPATPAAAAAPAATAPAETAPPPPPAVPGPPAAPAAAAPPLPPAAPGHPERSEGSVGLPADRGPTPGCFAALSMTGGPPAAPAAPAPVAPAAAPAAPPAPGTQTRSEIPREIALDPRDHLWVTWRERTPEARPAPRPFDREQGLRTLRRMEFQWSAYSGSYWRWERVGITPGLGADEARFWLAAILRAAIGLSQWNRTVSRLPPSPEDVAGALEAEGGDLELDLSLDALQAILSRFGDSRNPFPAQLIVPLSVLLSGPDLVDLLTRERLAQEAPASPHQYPQTPAPLMTAPLVSGYREYVLPYLTAEEMEPLRQRLLPRLRPDTWPATPNRRPNGAFYLAAMLGSHQPLRQLLESWADDPYSGEGWSDRTQRPQEIVFGLGSAQEVEAQFRRLKLVLRRPEYVRAWLAHTGYGALDVVTAGVLDAGRREEAATLGAELSLVVASEAAPPMLEVMRSSPAPAVGREWLDRHPAQAIAGLLPVAAGRSRLADGAVSYLQTLARRGQGPQIEATLAGLEGEGSLTREGAARLREALREEAEANPPLDAASTPDWLAGALRASRRKAVAWVRGIDLPAVVVGQHRINEAQADALIGALAASALELPHPLVTAVKEHATLASREAFAWALFESWLAEGAPSRESWALSALGLLGGDATALKLGPLIRVWPGEGQHKRAVAGLDCLRAIGTDTALMQINGIAQRVKFKALQARAAQCMEAVARDRNLSRAQLEDRVVPDCGLDERGRRAFDFGPRRFAFALGPGMKPAVRDESGALRPDLPRPTSRDDAALAEAAVGEWRLLKRQVAEVAKVQALRLEQAMVTGRRWPAAEFEALLVRHPLLTHLVRLLVWGTYGRTGLFSKGLQSTFRVTEDLTYAGVDDATWALQQGATVGIVHPLHLDEAQRGAWGELLADYEVVPPFPQLGRPLHRLEGDEGRGKEITRFAEVDVPAQLLVFTLEKLGWARGFAEDAGVYHFHTRAFPGAGVTAAVEYGGVPMGYMEGWEDQNMERAYFLPYVLEPGDSWGDRYPQAKKATSLGGVDPVAISEVLSDLSGIAARARAG